MGEAAAEQYNNNGSANHTIRHTCHVMCIVLFPRTDSLHGSYLFSPDYGRDDVLGACGCFLSLIHFFFF